MHVNSWRGRALRIGLLAGCLLGQIKPAIAEVFPANNVWNTRIDGLPVDPNSASYVNSLGATTHFHPDWGTDPSFGIPFNVVPINTKRASVSFQFADESDIVPYPLLNTMKIEGGTWAASNNGDRHVLVVCGGNVYETYDTTFVSTGHFAAGSGAIFDLYSNALRPSTWTSADAAGLPIYPALVKYDEAATGTITHAFRLTCQHTNNTFVWPARHTAGSATAGAPPFGQRFRLKASVPITGQGYSTVVVAILTAMKQYGMIVADLGSNWFVTGAPDPRWTDTDLNVLKSLTGSNFEAVNESSLQVSPDSGQAN
jgi:hypothetical protein